MNEVATMRGAAVEQLTDFRGKVVMVTGGSRGLGKAMVEAFSDCGANVVIASRKIDSCKVLADEIRAKGGRAFPIACHVGDWDGLEGVVEQIYAEFGKVDVLINNAGMSPTSPSSLEVSEALFDKVLSVNLKGPFRLSALIGSRMAAAEGGSIINVSSIGSLRPLPAYAPYASAKAALNALTTAHAFEYAPKVRVNAILPGSFETDIAAHWPEEKKLQIVSAIKRYGKPEEIISTALYLASSASSFTTGAMIRVDGGRP